MIGWCPEEHTRNAARLYRERAENGTYETQTTHSVLDTVVLYMLWYMEPTDRAVLPAGTYPEYQVEAAASETVSKTLSAQG